MIETASYVCMAACTLGTEPTWSRDRACVGGNMVRLYKLFDASLDQICKRRQEIGFILARLVFETLVNIRYMVDGYSASLMESYVEHSFRHERKLSDKIRENIAARGGKALPIEDRMLKSITRAASAAELQLDDTNPKMKGPWGGKNLFEKASAVGLEDAYLGAFGGASHNVHGNWHELYANHLHWDETTGFTPNLDWHIPRPQVVLALCLMTVETLSPYFSFMADGQALPEPKSALADLCGRIFQLTEAHEAYLSKKSWPAI